MTSLLLESPSFSTVRTKSGALAADSTTINTTNYPLSLGFDPGGSRNEIAVYWYASAGTVLPEDYIDLQVLHLDGTLATAAWREGRTLCGVKQNVLARIPVDKGSLIALRVVAVSCAGGTGLVVRAAAC